MTAEITHPAGNTARGTYTRRQRRGQRSRADLICPQTRSISEQLVIYNKILIKIQEVNKFHFKGLVLDSHHILVNMSRLLINIK